LDGSVVGVEVGEAIGFKLGIVDGYRLGRVDVGCELRIWDGGGEGDNGNFEGSKLGFGVVGIRVGL
jgi:hypothetical protein